MKSFYHLKSLGWTSGFRAINDLPRAHGVDMKFSRLFEPQLDVQYHMQIYKLHQPILQRITRDYHRLISIRYMHCKKLYKHPSKKD